MSPHPGRPGAAISALPLLCTAPVGCPHLTLSTLRPGHAAALCALLRAHKEHTVPGCPVLGACPPLWVSQPRSHLWNQPLLCSPSGAPGLCVIFLPSPDCFRPQLNHLQAGLCDLSEPQRPHLANGDMTANVPACCEKTEVIRSMVLSTRLTDKQSLRELEVGGPGRWDFPEHLTDSSDFAACHLPLRDTAVNREEQQG